MILPPGPVPTSPSTLRLCSATKRRTTGDNRRLSFKVARALSRTGAAAGATGATTTGAATTGAAATGATTTGATGAAGAATTGAAPEATPTTPITAPTGTVSPSGTRISVRTPAIGDGTSVSTLSVETSNKGSSAATVSPTFLNQRVIVPSVTVSPSWGSVTSAMTILFSAT